MARTPARPEAVGLVRMRFVERRKIPTATMLKLHVEIDALSQNCRLEIAETIVRRSTRKPCRIGASAARARDAHPHVQSGVHVYQARCPTI
jgi:hypothetical protein